MLSRWYLVLLLLSLVSCGEPGSEKDGIATESSSAKPPSSVAGPAAVSATPQSTASLWAGSCALCHVDGNAGAPRIGNQQEWGPRLVQSREILLQHTLEGLNQMPPLGYCMACEREDFLALIDMMTQGLLATEVDQ